MDFRPTITRKAERVRVIGLGVILYGFLSYITDYIPIAGSSLRPAIVILTIAGACFGPLTGFLLGAFGTLLTDVLSGQLWISWIIGNGVIGLFSGFASLHKEFDLNSGKMSQSHYVWLALWGISGNLIGLAGAAFFDILTGSPDVSILHWAIVPAAVNSLWILLLGLPIITAIVKRKAEDFRING
ncbi:ECF transporter S component [Brevibacillus borstelensis]|uniref:ECF transporter S component n=1 Tax=Brevibacillus borstelensis TaxID=45462 RepID=UPI0030C057F1